MRGSNAPPSVTESRSSVGSIPKRFRPFEEKVLRLLVTPVLGADCLEAILATADFVGYEYSGAGYFITVRHPLVPATRTVIDRPVVLGHAGEIQVGYLVFVENGELTLECHEAGPSSIPETFRDLHVEVVVSEV
jgi:hypothetical protein